MAAAAGALVTLPHAEVVPEREGGTLLFVLWVVTAIGATAGWWVLWRGAAGLLSSPAARRGTEGGRLDAGLVLPRLIAAYAILEAQLMAALVVSILGDTPMLLVPALTIFALGILLSFPRREWFAP